MSSKKSKSSETALPNMRPRFGRLAAAIAYSGICRSKLYEQAARTPNLFKKNGTAILVDFDLLDEVLDQLPAAKIKPKSVSSRHFDGKAAARPVGRPGADAERNTPQ
jgi:hypothetical protein